MRPVDSLGFEVRVLGPIDVVVDEEPVLLGSMHLRKLLASLVVAANHAVSIDRLADILWGDSPPPSRDNTLQSYVYRLRHLICPEAITSEDHSYTLRVEAHQLDALRFELLVNQAVEQRQDAPACAGLAREALAVWRGDPFGDIADVDPFRLEALRLLELRLFAMELKLECDLAMGRHEMAIGPLQALVQEYPYNERLWCLLVDALASSGRRVEALARIERLTAVLAEMDLHPSSQIRDFEERLHQG